MSCSTLMRKQKYAFTVGDALYTLAGGVSDQDI